MTNQEIITAIVLALISTFAKFIFEKILGPYIPDKKKLTSYIRKFFFFILTYILPVIIIMYFMITTEVVTKLFVFVISLNFSGLAINLSIYISWSLHSKSLENSVKTLDQIDGLHKLQETLNERLLRLEGDYLRRLGSTDTLEPGQE